MPQEPQHREPVVVERVQTGVRIEKRMLKVLKALAEQKDMTLGDLLEGIVLHAFEGKIVPFSAQTLKEIEQFKSLYGMTLKASTATTSRSADDNVSDRLASLDSPRGARLQLAFNI